jgi:hypothetical protein
LFILDEFDSVDDPKARKMFADSIKAISDNSPSITTMFVGIAESVTELIGDHPSLERCIKQIKLPKMSEDELGLIIDNGMKALQLDIAPEVRSNIIHFSNGFPHYAHLLGKYCAKAAIEDDCLKIETKHFNVAVLEAIENAQESVRDTYQTSIFSSKKENMVEDILYGCAWVKNDEYGTFRATDLIEPLKEITGVDYSLNSYLYHLGKLCSKDRKRVLVKMTHGKISRYKFRNPIFKAYVLLKLYQSTLNGRQLSLFK